MRGDAIVSATSAPRLFSNTHCSGRAGFFILGYCFYYYFARSEMSGFMQTAFYFGYMAMVRLHVTKHTSRPPACFSAPAPVMTRLVPSLIFFGLGLQVCYAFFLMLGTVGYRASLMFVRHIYRCAARALSCYC